MRLERSTKLVDPTAPPGHVLHERASGPESVTARPCFPDCRHAEPHLHRSDLGRLSALFIIDPGGVPVLP